MTDRQTAHAVVELASDHAPGPTASTSVRVPAPLHEAMRRAVDAAWAGSATELIIDGVRQRLAQLAEIELGREDDETVRAALDQHYAEHPDARPTLAMVAESAAKLEDHPASTRPDLIAAAVIDLGDEAFVEDVLAWVQGNLAARR